MQAGEGEDGRLKSAIGIGSLLMDGLGDTIRVSLTEDPEYELEPCRSAHSPPVNRFLYKQKLSSAGIYCTLPSSVLSSQV